VWAPFGFEVGRCISAALLPAFANRVKKRAPGRTDETRVDVNAAANRKVRL
jgi:hypothetical protein